MSEFEKENDADEQPVKRAEVHFHHCGINQRAYDEDGKVYCHACHDMIKIKGIAKHKDENAKPHVNLKMAPATAKK